MSTKDKPTRDFTFETVAVLCSALLSNNSTITTAQYEQMSALDGQRTACSFQHQFRAVLRRAKQLKEAGSEGDKPAPVKAKPKGKGKAAVGKKRGRAVKDEDIDEMMREMEEESEREEKKIKTDDDGDGMPALLTPPDFGEE